MKKLVLPLLTLIIGFIAGYYFANSKTKGMAESSSTVYTSGNSVSQQEAQMLVDTFGMYGLEDVNHKPGGKGQKTRSVFVRLGELDSLCAALDAARKKDGKTDGIRIYMGRYPKLQLDKMPYQHPFRNTIIFVSTKDTSVTLKGTKNAIRIHMDYFGAPNQKIPVGIFAVDPQNRGELCPDNCDGATLVCPDPNDPTCTGGGGN